MSEGKETRREQEELELPWLHSKRIIDPMKEYDAPKFLRQEKRAERTDFARKLT